ncbi:Hypothetical predicted protein [Olea europaea subsp. europaea]|uniref:Transmembrane protein n=1 Tax=Olea europaea subsp. europaea TaxID=158383 RepID=A0A8S0RLZ3_OLEEU|nr:Hypothetical predicted protein [Olea europaea subsp. europaea]
MRSAELNDDGLVVVATAVLWYFCDGFVLVLSVFLGGFMVVLMGVLWWSFYLHWSDAYASSGATTVPAIVELLVFVRGTVVVVFVRFVGFLCFGVGVVLVGVSGGSIVGVVGDGGGSGGGGNGGGG